MRVREIGAADEHHLALLREAAQHLRDGVVTFRDVSHRRRWCPRRGGPPAPPHEERRTVPALGQSVARPVSKRLDSSPVSRALDETTLPAVR
jgi:hypothetical protein